MGTEKSEQSAEPTDEGTRRRYGWQDRQEAESKAQFCGRLAKLGWNAMQPAKDLGEDYLVQIYDDGVSSGLSFYVQLKSTRDSDALKSQGDPTALRYALEVKDVEHWEVQSPPVVLFVWDVEKHEGYWATIPQIVDALDKEGTEWRKQKTVTVRVPVEHGTDDEGMRRLRWAIAEIMLPLFNGRSPVTIKMTMTKTAFDTLASALDRGSEITLRDELIPNIEMPVWHRRIFGKLPASRAIQFLPGHATEGIVLRVEVHVGKAVAAIPHVELRPMGPGIKHIYWSNEHQQHPMVFSIEGEGGADTLQFKFRRTRFGNTIQEAREITKFTYLANQPGGFIRVIDARSGQVVFGKPTQGKSAELMALLKERYNIVEKLAELEPYLSDFGTVDLSNGLGDDDIDAIEILYQAARTGRVEFVRHLSFEVPPGVHEPPSAGPITMHRELILKLLGLNIRLRAMDTAVNADEFLLKSRAAHAEACKTRKPVRVDLDNLQIVTELLNWPPPRDRIQNIASSQSGYVTLAQAIEAGFTSAEQLQIHERVELVADGVYRFVHYPPSDHEDLVITWLQTEKQGVFSHDTALALHEVSDILPVRQHVTVPPGWKPIEGMQLSANTVVHHGTVDESEITWMGPVPFTKPLRTLVDCIDDQLPPDILDQALSDAYRRGMLSPGELHTLQARKAKSA